MSRGQNGTPVVSGEWYKLNECSDIHSSDHGSYKPSQVNFAYHNATITMTNVGGPFSCGGYNGSNFSSSESYLSGSIMLHDLNLKPTAGHNIVMEAMIKVGKGWPAFWLLGGNAPGSTGCQPTSWQSWDNFSSCAWSSNASDSAEIDIMEMYESRGYTINGENVFMNSNSNLNTQNVTDATANFHLYHLDWSTTQLCWAVDGVSTNCTASLVPTTPMFIIIENRVGSAVPSSFPQVMTIQYVQVCDAGSGTTCSQPDSRGGNTIFLDDFGAPVAPEIFFTDLTSGPNSGGENSGGFAGAYVTLYGSNFGLQSGNGNVSRSITWNGLNCLRLVGAPTPHLWYQQQTVQLGAGCTTGTGNFIVSSPTGGTSNASPFTVRSGNIRCVSTGGNDVNSGTFAGGCWGTIRHAAHSMSAGDISYVQNGVNQTTVDDYNAAIAITAGGAAGSPIALVTYPGASSTIGTDLLNFGVRTPAIAGDMSNVVLAGFDLHGMDALDIGSINWRVVGNTAQCPNGQGQDACMQGAQYSGNLTYYGNYIYNVGLNCPASNCKQYHGLYLTTDSNHVWIGWNEINPDPAHTGHAGCRALQFNSTPEGGGSGLDQYDLHVHDNYIHNAICDGINFNTVNPDAGTVEAYNNVIWHVGTGPNPPVNQEANYTCFNLGSAAVHTNPVLLYNNTMYDCGAISDITAVSDRGMLSPYIPVRMNNNIIYQSNAGVPYISNNTSGFASKVTGSNNIWYGAGAKPAGVATTGDLSNVNPLLTNTSWPDFTLTSSSPAIGAGTASLFPTSDLNGLLRSSPPSIGAYEFAQGTSGTKPNPPASLTVVVQ